MGILKCEDVQLLFWVNVLVIEYLLVLDCWLDDALRVAIIIYFHYQLSHTLLLLFSCLMEENVQNPLFFSTALQVKKKNI